MPRACSLWSTRVFAAKKNYNHRDTLLRQGLPAFGSAEGGPGLRQGRRNPGIRADLICPRVALWLLFQLGKQILDRSELLIVRVIALRGSNIEEAALRGENVCFGAA
jgi:hypothetical protein